MYIDSQAAYELISHGVTLPVHEGQVAVLEDDGKRWKPVLSVKSPVCDDLSSEGVLGAVLVSN